MKGSCGSCGQNRASAGKSLNYSVVTKRGNTVFISANKDTCKAVAKRYNGAQVLDGAGKVVA